MHVTVCPIWYGQDLFMREAALGGVLVTTDDWEPPRLYALAWLPDTPQALRETVVRALEGLWTSERTIFHEVRSSLAARGIILADPVMETETEDLMTLAEQELGRLPRGTAGG